MVDLHTHLASHIPYGFMLRGGTPSDQPPANLPTYKHTFEQQMYRQWLMNSGIKVFVDAGLVNIFKFEKEAAKDQILRQFEWTQKFVNENSDAFALAKTPMEAKQALDNGKIVFVRALEGAEFLVSSPDDVKYWKSLGVAMIGPIHLVDNMYGDASIMPGGKGILNPLGSWRRLFNPQKRKGLTELGKKAVNMLLDEGIIVDLAHMSPESTDQSIAIHEKRNLPVIMSHGYLREIRNDPRGLTKQQVQKIYELQGMIAITSGEGMLHPHDSDFAGKGEDYCKNTIDDYLLHYKKLQQYVGEEAPIGWGSDANGFVSHFRPKYGQLGCFPMGKNSDKFLAHGLRGLFDLKAMFNFLDSQGIATEPIKNSSVRFLEVWQKLYDQANN